jgi:hypothetical protein
MSGVVGRAISAAAAVTGRRFGMLVASSLVATSAIVASAMTNPTGNGPLAALLGRSLAAGAAPVATAPTSPASSSGPTDSSPEPSGGGSGVVGGSGGGGGDPQGSGPSPNPTVPTTPATPSPRAGRVKHVFVISLASPGYDASFGSATQMPYLANTLRPQGQLLPNYSLLDDSGLPNRIAAVSGQPPNAQTKADCPTYSEFPSGAAPDRAGVVSASGCLYPVSVLTLADQLGAAHFSWRAYVDGMVDVTGKPHNCVHPGSDEADQPTPGGYAARQNPFVYFHSLLDLGDCAVNDVPLSGLGGDLSKAKTTPNVSFLASSPCGAGAAGQCPSGAADGAAAADEFLSTWVPQILSSAAYKRDGLLVVTFDGAASVNTPIGTAPVGTLLVSRFAQPGATDSAAYGPYSLLRSIEDLFGLDHLAKAADPKVRSFAAPLLGQTADD